MAVAAQTVYLPGPRRRSERGRKREGREESVPGLPTNPAVFKKDCYLICSASGSGGVVSSSTSKALQRASNDSLAGQQNMHGLVDSSDPGMESAETEEVAVSGKRVCVGFGAPDVGCFWKELQVQADAFLFMNGILLFPPGFRGARRLKRTSPVVSRCHRRRLEFTENSF